MATERLESVGTLDELVGDNVRIARGRMSLATLGTEVRNYLGYTWPRQTVWKIEHGKRSLDARELIAIALVLGVPVTTLLTDRQSLDERNEVELSTDPENPWTMTVDELRGAVMGSERAADAARERHILLALAGEVAQLAASIYEDAGTFDAYYGQAQPSSAEAVIAGRSKTSNTRKAKKSTTRARKR